ncbi:MAG: transcription elongation factor subunit Spt4 [Acidilobaceae archaeon]
MKPRRVPTKKPALKACRACGTLNPRDSTNCSSCGSTQFSDEWSGLIIVFDPSTSLLARSAEITEPVIKAVRVAGKIVVKMRE